jgi:tetratricopeptide (TPR) repeat protein
MISLLDRRLAVVLMTFLLLTLVGGIGPARAEVSAEERARQASDHAATQYKLGRFDRAAALYAQAYELYPVPPLLFNLGQCHRKLDNHERAIYFFEGYLREAPEARNRALVVDLIREQRRAIAAREQMEARRQHREQTSALRMQAAVARVVADDAPFLPAPTPPPERDGPAIYERWWFWTAAGAIAVVGGAYAIGHTSGPDADLGLLDRR